MRDLTIDFNRTFNSEGTVVAKGDGWLEIEFPEDYLCDIVNGCLRFRDAEGTVYPFSNPAGVRRREARTRRSVPRTTGCRTGRSRPKNAPTATSAFCAKT